MRHKRTGEDFTNNSIQTLVRGCGKGGRVEDSWMEGREGTDKWMEGVWMEGRGSGKGGRLEDVRVRLQEGWKGGRHVDERARRNRDKWMEGA